MSYTARLQVMSKRLSKRAGRSLYCVAQKLSRAYHLQQRATRTCTKLHLQQPKKLEKTSKPTINLPTTFYLTVRAHTCAYLRGQQLTYRRSRATTTNYAPTPHHLRQLPLASQMQKPVHHEPTAYQC